MVPSYDQKTKQINNWKSKHYFNVVVVVVVVVRTDNSSRYLFRIFLKMATLDIVEFSKDLKVLEG